MRAAAPLLFLVAGCAAAAGLADPPLAQLARWRNAAPDAIAAEPVVAPCPAGNPACRGLHALRAEACLGQALAARAPGAACPASRSAPLLDCAAEGYAAALAASAGTPAGASTKAPAGAPPDAAAGAPTLRAGLAQALLCRAELDAPATAAPRAAAAAAEGAPPDVAALHGTRAALVLARVGPAASQRCAAARRALGLGLAAGAPSEHRAGLRADALLHLGPCEAPR